MNYEKKTILANFRREFAIGRKEEIWTFYMMKNISSYMNIMI